MGQMQGLVSTERDGDFAKQNTIPTKGQTNFVGDLISQRRNVLWEIMMKFCLAMMLAILGLMVPLYRVAAGSKVVRVDWNELHKSGQLRSGTIVEDSTSVQTSNSLLLSNSTTAAIEKPVRLLTDTDLQPAVYTVHARFRSELSDQVAAFEFLLFGPNGGVLNSVRSVPVFDSHSHWNDCILHFEWTKEMGELQNLNLNLNVLLPPEAKIWIEPATVFAHHPGKSRITAKLACQWWSSNQSLWIMAGTGLFAVICCGAARRSSTVGWSRLYLSAAAVASTISLLLAGSAYWYCQPQFVAAPMLLTAVSSMIVSVLVARSTRHVFGNHEAAQH